MEIEKIYTIYAESDDITFIMRDMIGINGTESTEVLGFYFGEPNDESTEKYKFSTKAEF